MKKNNLIGVKNLNSLVWFSLLSIFFALNFYFSPQIDIERYQDYYQNFDPSFIEQKNAIREPVFFYFFPLLGYIFGLGEITLVLILIFSASLIIATLRNLGIPNIYSLPVITFPVIFVMYDNVLRQYLSVWLLLFAFSLFFKLKRDSLKEGIYLVVSFLTHNAIFLSLPLIFFYKYKLSSIKKFKNIGYFLSIVIAITLIFFYNTEFVARSSANTGQDLSLHAVIATIFMGLAYQLLEYLLGNKIPYHTIAYTTGILFFLLIMNFSSSSIERSTFVFMSFYYLMIIKLLNKIFGYIMVPILIIVNLIVLFKFPSTHQMMFDGILI